MTKEEAIKAIADELEEDYYYPECICDACTRMGILIEELRELAK